MSPYGIFRFFQLSIGLVIMMACAIVFVSHEVYVRARTEWQYYAQYGADWKDRYATEQRVSAEQTTKEIMVGVAGLVAIPVLGFLIYRQIVPKRRRPSGSRRRRKSSWSLPT